MTRRPDTLSLAAARRIALAAPGFGAPKRAVTSWGPLAASDFEQGKSRSDRPASRSLGGGWWEWGDTKRALEWLFWTGRITTATRRGSFERVYDLAERVLPPAILALPTPDEAEAHRRLVALSARALGIATAGDLRDYFRLGVEETRIAIAELVEAGTLLL